MIPSDIEKLKAEFGDREFTGSDLARALGMKSHHGSSAKLMSMCRKNIIYATKDGYRFGAPPDMPAKNDVAPSAPTTAASEVLSTLPSLVRIGEFYLSERMLLIVHTGNQEGSPALRFHTTILEIDPATKHPRNKIINFVKSRDPREYAQAIAWLDSLAGDPHTADDTALELAADLEAKLNAANKEIANLKAKLEAIQGMLRGTL